MSRFPQFLAAVAAAVLVVPGGALAGTLTLHPAGFGAMSYSSWKAHQGEPDDVGSDAQALYFQKGVPSATVAAGVAVIKGIGGIPVSQLTGLAWDHRVDGHCGAGAPRWNLALADAAGHPYTVFLGCYAADHRPVTPQPTGPYQWCHDTYLAGDIISQIQTQTGIANPSDAAALTLRGLAIVFDEGPETGNPPPAGCDQTNLTSSGYVHLDNIAVQANGVDHCWTSADDNGDANNALAASTTCSGSFASVFQLAIDTTLPVGLPVDPTDTQLVDALNLAYPGVPLPSWLLYPSVLY